MNSDDILKHGEFALASYADLSGTIDIATALQQQGKGLSAAQAVRFVSLYSVVTQFNDTAAEGGMGTSFSATVFKDASGKLTLAVRGTLEAGDFLPTDANIALNGAGYDQVVAMANWWRRASAPAGQMVQQYAVVGYAPTASIPPGNPLLYSGLGIIYFLEAAPNAAATGEIVSALAADSDNKVNVTGHSLGGHLSMAFNTLFPGTADQVAVFNAPGFADTTTNQQFFAMLGGTVPTSANSANVTNVIADEATIGNAPWSAFAGKHSRPGAAVDIPIENQWLSDEPNPADPRNHSQMVLTDSLAVYNLLSQLSPAPS